MLLRSLNLVLISASLTWAQSETGTATVNGTILDPSGAAVAGASISAVSRQTGFTRTTQSNESGLYTMVRLPAGRYDLSVEMAGFKASKRTDIPLNVGSVVTLDVPLEVGAATEQVTVTADVPLVETTRSQTSTVVNEKAVRELPINGRNFLDFALLTPGVSRDPRGGDLSFGGQRGTANSLLVDGGDSNNLFFGQSSGRAGTRNPYSFSQDAVQEFQVNTSGYAAEMGRAGGGVINVITKSGTNDIHGTAFWFFRDRSLNANTFINNSRNIARQPYHYNQFGGNLGGPVRKDKLFFFFNYDGQRNTNPNPVFFSIVPPADDLSQQAGRELQQYLTPYTRNFDNNIYTFKADWNISTNQNLSVRYNRHTFTGKNLENSGQGSAAGHTGNSNVETDNLATNYTRVLGSIWSTMPAHLSRRR
ncbi:MAG: carboxypeptidase regulatory-like domain-containing protein [Bryobacteraceae bacterium]